MKTKNGCFLLIRWQLQARDLHLKQFSSKNDFAPVSSPNQITLVNSIYWFKNTVCSLQAGVSDMSYNIAFVIWRINISLGEESPNAGSCLMLSNIAFGMSGINIYIVRSPMDHHIMMIIIISEINIYILRSPSGLSIYLMFHLLC